MAGLRALMANQKIQERMNTLYDLGYPYVEFYRNDAMQVTVRIAKRNGKSIAWGHGRSYLEALYSATRSLATEEIAGG